MRGHKADPFDSAHIPDREQEICKIMVAVEVRVDILYKQGDLLAAARRQCLRFRQHVVQRTASLAAAGVRHHAEGAEVVAPAHDRDPCGYARDRVGSDVGIGLILRTVGCQFLSSFPGVLQQLG